MATGVVKWFSAEKAFGFIKSDDGDGDIFVHISAVPKGLALQEGDLVSYEKAERKGKTYAINLQILD
jgi:CspA family cold shock protein